MMRFLSRFTAGSVSLCAICIHVVAFGLSEVVVVPYVDALVTVMRVLLFVLPVWMLCEGAD